MAQKKIGYATSAQPDILQSLQNILHQMEAFDSKIDNIAMREDELFEILAEHNVLMRTSLGLFSYKKRFPILTEEDLKTMNEELQGENRAEIISNMTHILGGSLEHLERILDANLVQTYNYDGTKGKKSLKSFSHLLSALFESTSQDGKTHTEFVSELRQIFRKVKNKMQKRDQKQKVLEEQSQCN